MRKDSLPVFMGLCALALLAMAAAATADSEKEDNDYDDEGLYAYADRARCNLNFSSKVLDDTLARVPQASSLNEWADRLARDVSQLKSLADANDSAAFHRFIKETLHDDLKDADEAVRRERKNYSAYNVTRNVTDELKGDYKKAKEAFSRCEKKNSIKVAQQRVNVYLHFLSKRQEEVAKLAKRNITTTNLSAVITSAQTEIVQPIQDAINSGNASQAAAALRQYCLQDGCRNGTNFHFSAKFEQARLAALLGRESAKARRAGWEDNSKEAEKRLERAKSALRSLGNSSDPEQSERLWELTKQSVEALKKLRENTKEVQEQLKEARQQNAERKANNKK